MRLKVRQNRGEVGDFGFVGFLVQGIPLEHFAGRVEDAEEFPAQVAELFLAERALQADDEVGADEAVGNGSCDRSARYSRGLRSRCRSA